MALREEKERATLLSEGAWSEQTTWQFFLSKVMPPLELCTAVCCVTAYKGHLLLVRNKRGWEMPAGKIETGETPLQAIIREVAEETGYSINKTRLFGYKKLTSINPVKRADGSSLYYPFPDSYAVFFVAEAVKTKESIITRDILEITLATYQEAKDLLLIGHQYDDILQYVLNNKLIDISQTR